MSYLFVILGAVCWTRGLEGVEGGKAAIIANVEPVTAALPGFALFHERPGVWVLLGIVCVLSGVMLLSGEK